MACESTKLLTIGERIGWPPIARCTVHVIRYTRKPLDKDNLYSSVKGLMDVLQPCSRTHPNGLGLIAEDSLECVKELTVDQARGDNWTHVEIQELA